MEKANIDVARAQAAQVAAVLTPLLTALQSAGEVLSVASNAEKHRAALLDEVEALKEAAAALRSDVAGLKAEHTELQAAVGKATAEAQKAAREAAAKAAEQARAAEDAAQARAAAAAAEAAEKEAAFTQHILDVQRDTDAEVAALFTRKQDAEDAALAAEARLQAVRDQAAKMAASLAG